MAAWHEYFIKARNTVETKVVKLGEKKSRDVLARHAPEMLPDIVSFPISFLSVACT